ncbi:MAG: hypothetical protein GXX79_17665 [Actinomycetales bacterium]|nr:hypothetical protein [Actinomycetales bacterium]
MNDVHDLLERAARVTPVERDPVTAVLRRAERMRRLTTMRAGAAVLAAAAVTVICLTVPEIGWRPSAGEAVPGDAPPARTWSSSPPAPERSASRTADTTTAPGTFPSAEQTIAPPPAVTSVGARGLNGVTVTTGTVTVSTAAEGCAGRPTTAPGPASQGPSPCLSGRSDGPAALVTPALDREWTYDYPGEPGIRLVDGTAVWLTETDPTTAWGSAAVIVPSRGVVVTLIGTPSQRAAQLASIRIAPPPPGRVPALFGSTEPVAVSAVTAGFSAAGGTEDAPVVAELTRLLTSARDVSIGVTGDSPRCLPAFEDTVLLTVNTSRQMTEELPDDPTVLVTDLHGRCGLVYSGTGAVLDVDRSLLDPLLATLLTSH